MLYPELFPFKEGQLPVSGGHTLHYELSGVEWGIPVVLVHGGPGGGITPIMRRFHDPKKFCIIGVDQRGCGRSTPHASVEHNTTWDLVDDLERLRRHLLIDKWHVFGGSWGSTLSLAYAITHPDKVLSLTLRGIFTLRTEEIRWFYQEGASFLFPEAFQIYKSVIPLEEQGDFLTAYHKRLNDKDPNIHMPAAKAWSQWEGRTLSLLEDPTRVDHFGDPQFSLAFARIENHYFMHKGFFPTDGWIYERAHTLSHIPTTLIHGRYDVCTPVKNAVDLKAVMPHAELVIVPDAGHAVSEQGIVRALIGACAMLV